MRYIKITGIIIKNGKKYYYIKRDGQKNKTERIRKNHSIMSLNEGDRFELYVLTEPAEIENSIQIYTYNDASFKPDQSLVNQASVLLTKSELKFLKASLSRYLCEYSVVNHLEIYHNNYAFMEYERMKRLLKHFSNIINKM